jgi:hypothetical protein
MSVFTTTYTTPWWLRVLDHRIEAERAAGTLPPAPVVRFPDDDDAEEMAA